MIADKHHDRFHGRVGTGMAACAYPNCGHAGEFRALNRFGRRSTSEGPGDYQLLCLTHIREFNAGYDWFAGMSTDEIAAAQSPTYVWPNETRAFTSAASANTPPKWQDFTDPIDIIATRFRGTPAKPAPRPRADGFILHPEDRRAMTTLGLSDDAGRAALRRAYTLLLRKYHPDRNRGNRAHEKALQDVLAAYTQLKNHPAFQ